MDLGLTSAVGVCNYSTPQLEEIHGLLSAKSIPLASNQVGRQTPSFCLAWENAAKGC